MTEMHEYIVMLQVLRDGYASKPVSLMMSSNALGLGACNFNMFSPSSSSFSSSSLESTGFAISTFSTSAICFLLPFFFFFLIVFYARDAVIQL
jgi:hypothetical protein